MLKPMLKLIRHRGRGFYAPALLAAPSRTFLLRRFGRASRGHLFAGAGVIAATVTVVSLLTWWAPDSDRPISHPMEAIKRVLPGVLEKVDEQVTTLLGTDKGTVLRNVREGLEAVGSGISWPGEKLREVITDRSANASISPAAPSKSEEPSSPSATETPPPTTSEPTSPPAPETPPVTEAPSPEEPPPPTPEKLPLPVEEIVDKPAPPTVEEPPSGAPPPVTEAPPSAPVESPPATDQPPPPPTTERTAGAE